MYTLKVTSNFSQVLQQLVNMKVCAIVVCVATVTIYKDVWDAVIGKELQCEREPDTNSSNRSVCMQSRLRNGIITGHLLHKYHEPVPCS